MKEQKGCKSETHAPSCPCQACKKPEKECPKCPQLTIQHVIPRCIGRKILGMSESQIDSYSRPESKPCHRKNDAKVGQVFELMMKQQRQGVIFSLQDVFLMRKQGKFQSTK